MANELVDNLINEKKDKLRNHIQKAVDGGISVEEALKSIIKILYQVSGGSVRVSNMSKILDTIEFLTYALKYYDGEVRDNISQSIMMLTQLLYYSGNYVDNAIIFQ